MLGFDAIARNPLAGQPQQGDQPIPGPNPVNVGRSSNTMWRSVAGTGYNASITFQLKTISSTVGRGTAGVTLRVNGFDLMAESGGLL